MHSSTLNFVLLTTLAARSITASPTHSMERGLEVVDITPSIDPQDQKRGLEVVDITPSIDPQDQKRDLEYGTLDIDSTNEKRDIQRRNYNIDHCGVNHGQWMPLNATSSSENGFTDAVQSFCSHFDGTVIPAQNAVAALVQSTGGEVLRLSDGTIGHFMGTIYCRSGNTCTIASSTCQEYMNAIGSASNPTSPCYGKKNKDCRGGRNDLAGSYFDAVPLVGSGT